MIIPRSLHFFLLAGLIVSSPVAHAMKMLQSRISSRVPANPYLTIADVSQAIGVGQASWSGMRSTVRWQVYKAG